MAIGITCSDGSHGPVNDHRCTCTGGKWDCPIASRGSGLCATARDAATD